ncbi:MAG: hypothetical protein Q9216_002464 [Gyalolechia sp. 2 TL-2023]
MSLNSQKHMMALQQRAMRESGLSISLLHQYAPPILSARGVIANYGCNNITQRPVMGIQPQEQITKTPPTANSIPHSSPGLAVSPIDLTNDDNDCPPVTTSTPAPQPSRGNNQGKRKRCERKTADPQSRPARTTKKPKVAKAPAKEQKPKAVRHRPSRQQKALDFEILQRQHGNEFFKIFDLPKDDEVVITEVRQTGVPNETEQSDELQEADAAKDSNEQVLSEDPQRRKAQVKERLRAKHAREERTESMWEEARRERRHDELQTKTVREEPAQQSDLSSETDNDEVTGEDLMRFMEEESEAEENEKRQEEENTKKQKEREMEAERERQKRRWAEEIEESSEEE